MKKKMVFAVVLFVVLLTIAVVLIKTPLLHLNEENTSGKYQGFYTTITQLDYSYVLYLVTNGKIKEAYKQDQLVKQIIICQK